MSLPLPFDHNLVYAIKLDNSASLALFKFFVELIQPFVKETLFFRDLDFFIAYFKELLFEIPRAKRTECFP